MQRLPAPQIQAHKGFYKVSLALFPMNKWRYKYIKSQMANESHFMSTLFVLNSFTILKESLDITTYLTQIQFPGKTIKS